MQRADLVRLRRARDRMDREFAQPLDVPSLAAGEYMSAGHFSRLFREAFGETPYSYLMTRRIERAKEMLRTSDAGIADIAVAVGFASVGTFGTRFAELVGEPPSAYRARAHDGFHGIPAYFAKIRTRPVRNREARVRTRS